MGVSLTRRTVLTLLAALPAPAFALGEPPVGIGRLALADLPDPRPGALVALLQEVDENTSVQPDLRVREVDPGSAALFDQPFVVLSGDRGFAPLTDEAVSNLRLYLREGGFLFVDDASGLEKSDFDVSVRRLLARVLPGSPLEPIGREHAVYRSFFLLRGVPGRIVVRPYLEGVWVGDITPVLYSRNDLLGALQRAGDGYYTLEVVPGGQRQRVECRKLGLNIVLFALTGNYKRDGVHVETLLDRMRRQGGYSP